MLLEWLYSQPCHDRSMPMLLALILILELMLMRTLMTLTQLLHSTNQNPECQHQHCSAQ
jgi:hypothetical protein